MITRALSILALVVSIVVAIMTFAPAPRSIFILVDDGPDLAQSCADVRWAWRTHTEPEQFEALKRVYYEVLTPKQRRQAVDCLQGKKRWSASMP